MIIIHSKQSMKKTMKIGWGKIVFGFMCLEKAGIFFCFMMRCVYDLILFLFFDHDDKTMFATKNVCWVHTFIFTFTKKNIIFIDSLLIHFFFSLSIYGIA